MILDRTHRGWAIASVIVLGIATAGYILYHQFTPTGPQGGTLIGLWYGIAAGLLMVFAGLLALRRRVFFLTVGSRQFWLRGHIWLGLLSVPMALFHSGFGLGGPVEIGLWALTGIVVLSGVWGLTMQHLLPRLMTLRVPEETFDEQVEHRLDVLRVECDLAVAEAVGPLVLPEADLLPAYLEADLLLHAPADGPSPEPNSSEPKKPAGKKSEHEVQLPLTRVEDYLRKFVRWPHDLRPLEAKLGVRGRSRLAEALTTIGEQLNAMVQVALDRGKVPKTDIWGKLPAFVAGIYRSPNAPPEPAPSKVEPAPARPEPGVSDPAAAAAIARARAAVLKPASGAGRIELSGGSPQESAPPAKPLSKIELIRQQQLAKAHAAGSPQSGVHSPQETGSAEPPPAKPLSKIELIRQQQLAAKLKKEQSAEGSQAAGAPTDIGGSPAPVAELENPTPKPVSKIELIRQQQLAAKQRDQAGGSPQSGVHSPQVTESASPQSSEEAAPEEPPAKPLSKIELIRQQQLAKLRKEQGET